MKRCLAVSFAALILLAFMVALAGAADIPALELQRWQQAKLTGMPRAELWNAARFYQAHREIYEQVHRMRPGGMPAVIVFALHNRESGHSFSRHLHEGSPLTHRTRDIPRGRPVAGHPPFTWLQSAEDALYILKREDLVHWADDGEALYAIEKYNGTGYLRYHPKVPTPYLWAGTTLYLRGKYVADGRFDPLAIDRQLGCAAVLKFFLSNSIQ